MGGFQSQLTTPTSIGNDFKTKCVLMPEDISSLPLVPHWVYAQLSELVYNQPDAPPLPEGWELLVDASKLNLDKEGYFAGAYINPKLRHCIIAHRGTFNVLGLRAGIWVYFEERTIQFSLARQFSKLVRLHLNLTHGETPEWFVSYTGHSLGAVLAACRAVEDHTYAVTFESPGCKNFIEKTMSPFKAEDVDIITYLRPPNPVNSLRPQCGYIVQIPSELPENITPPQPRVISSSLLRMPFIPSPQEFLRGQLPRVVGIPDLQQYITKIEPLVREMLEKTQQLHAIRGIVKYFKEEDEHLNEQVVLRWPSNLMQFLEYYNTTKALEDPVNQQANAKSAYSMLLRDLYVTTERQRKSLPLRYLNKDSINILRLWSRLTPAKLLKLPLTEMDHKVLNTTTIEEDCMHCSVLTAFQTKQYLSFMIFRPEVRKLLDKLTSDPLLVDRSKL